MGGYMDNYSVLLVDDEEEVIHVIMRKINWEGLGFSVAGHANNGAKALEMVEEFQPDVVMTDIRMPFMDGMELSRRIKAEYPATKILFFTGFDEFEYAKGAVQLEVEEYILKPVNLVELTNYLSLDRVCEVLGVSNSYFSSVFKKETGNSFIRYLTDYRMERASQQLIGTNEKSYIIAKNVGYTDPNYFSYVFKRKFGVSPSKYRREHIEGEE